MVNAIIQQTSADDCDEVEGLMEEYFSFDFHKCCETPGNVESYKKSHCGMSSFIFHVINDSKETEKFSEQSCFSKKLHLMKYNFMTLLLCPVNFYWRYFDLGILALPLSMEIWYKVVIIRCNVCVFVSYHQQSKVTLRFGVGG